VSRAIKDYLTVFLVGGVALAVGAMVLGPAGGDFLLPIMVAWIAIGGASLLLHEIWTRK
jgi:Na+-translocating ferredoxin:NAD+ oxidoreductase RnfD subunit